MNQSSEAGPQRLHGGVAQPQNSTKESLTDMTLLLTIDHTAQSSRASSKSTSLALLLHLHTNVGAVVVRRRDECSSPRRARCVMQPPLSRAHAYSTRGCARHRFDLSSSRTERQLLHSRTMTFS